MELERATTILSPLYVHYRFCACSYNCTPFGLFTGDIFSTARRDSSETFKTIKGADAHVNVSIGRESNVRSAQAKTAGSTGRCSSH